MSRPVELDWNATTPLRAEARDAWLAAVERWPGNPSSVHRLAQEAHAARERSSELLELAREMERRCRGNSP